MHLLKRLYASSVWGPDAIPIEDYKYRNLKRVFLPLVDFLYLFAGLSAVRYGVPAINEFFPDEVVDLFGWLLAAGAVIAFVGLAFPRLWYLEAAGKIALLSMMTAYVGALLILTRAGQDSRGFVFVIALLASMIVVFRLSFLGSERRDRRAKK